jgi:hypothetical protein
MFNMSNVAYRGKAIDVSSDDYVGTGLLWSGSGGVIKVDFYDGDDAQTIPSVPAGVTIPCLVKRVYSDTTTATGMLILKPK